MQFFVYILYSERTCKYYTGSTQDVLKRLERHNLGHAISTRTGIPWRVVYSRGFETRTEAVQAERHIKSQKSKAYIEKMIQEYSSAD